MYQIYSLAETRGDLVTGVDRKRESRHRCGRHGGDGMYGGDGDIEGTGRTEEMEVTAELEEVEEAEAEIVVEVGLLKVEMEVGLLNELVVFSL